MIPTAPEQQALIVFVFVALLAERILESIVDARHRRQLRDLDAVRIRGDAFSLIVIAQVFLFTGPLLELVLTEHAGLGRASWFALTALVLAQMLRWSAVRTLGERWTLRVFVVPDAARIQHGPYRWLRHPNYLAVLVEYAALPVFLGAWWSLGPVVALGVLATAQRIAVEDAALDGAAASQVEPMHPNPS